MEPIVLEMHVWFSDPVRLDGELCSACWCAARWALVMVTQIGQGSVDARVLEFCANCRA